MVKDAKNGRRRGGVAEAEDEGDGVAVAEEESPFKYYVKGERIRSDGAFFELLLTRVLQEQGALPDFDEVWPRGAQALAGLNTLRLSQHSADELGNVIRSVGGEFAARFGNRTGDLIVWADAFWRIRQIYGSFRQYVRSFDTDGHEALIADLSQRLTGLSPSMIVSFLREAGEKIPLMPQIDPVPPGGVRPGKPQQQAVRQHRGDGQGGGGRRRQRGGNKHKGGGDKPPEQQPQAQQKPAATGQEKGGSRGRRGRRGFFRRRRSGRGTPAEGSNRPPETA